MPNLRGAGDGETVRICTGIACAPGWVVALKHLIAHAKGADSDPFMKKPLATSSILACALILASPDLVVAQGGYWVQLEAHLGSQSARQALERHVMQDRVVSVRQMASGWYALVKGPYVTRAEATSSRRSLLSRPGIRHDIFVADGTLYLERAYTDLPTSEHSMRSEQPGAVLRAVLALHAAFPEATDSAGEPDITSRQSVTASGATEQIGASAAGSLPTTGAPVQAETGTPSHAPLDVGQPDQANLEEGLFALEQRLLGRISALEVNLSQEREVLHQALRRIEAIESREQPRAPAGDAVGSNTQDDTAARPSAASGDLNEPDAPSVADESDDRMLPEGAGPADPAVADETLAEARRTERALSRDERASIQAALAWFGHYALDIDAAFGAGTRRAMAGWQRAQGLQETGVLTTMQRARLLQDHADAMRETAVSELVPPPQRRMPPDGRGADVPPVAPRDLQPGQTIPGPARFRSGFFVDAQGTVVTTAEALSGCTRVTIDEAYSVNVHLLDEAAGIAVITPQTPLVPLAFARFASNEPQVDTVVRVAGFSYQNTLTRPAITLGQLGSMAPLNGENSLHHLVAQVRPGDAGGPVFDETGAVIGMLLPRPGDPEGQVPDETNFALSASAVMQALERADRRAAFSQHNTAISTQELLRISADLTVLVSCGA